MKRTKKEVSLENEMDFSKRKEKQREKLKEIIKLKPVSIKVYRKKIENFSKQEKKEEKKEATKGDRVKEIMYKYSDGENRMPGYTTTSTITKTNGKRAWKYALRKKGISIYDY